MTSLTVSFCIQRNDHIMGFIKSVDKIICKFECEIEDEELANGTVGNGLELEETSYEDSESDASASESDELD